MVKVILLWKRSIIFCFECEEYEGLRQDLFDVNIFTNKNMHSFNKIMSSNDDIVINRVAKFISEEFKKRSEHKS